MQPVDARIESVTVYHQGATVTRRAVLAGTPAEVTVAGLPLSLGDGSVRVRALAAKVYATHVRVGLHVQKNDAPPAAPDVAERERLRQAVLLVEEACAELQNEVALLRAVPVPERPEAEPGKMPPASPMAARMQLEEVTEAAVGERLARLRELSAEHEKLADEQRVVEQRMALASSARAVRPEELKKAVTVRLQYESAVTGSFELLIDYHVPGARWAPSYQCRMQRDCRGADIVMRALVCQRSGEDWAGVKLCLSTAAPLSWTELPELASVRIGKLQAPPAARAGFRPPPTGAVALFADHDRDRRQALALVPPPPQFPVPELQLPGAPRRPAAPQPQVGRAAKTMSARDEDTTLARAMPSGMPPPAPPPAPPSAAAPARRRMRAESAVEAEAEASYDVADDLSALKKKMGKVVDKADRGEAAPEAEAGLHLFSALRLPGPEEASRSRLRQIDTRQAYHQSLEAFAVAVPFDPLSAVADAVQAALAVAALPAPSGTADVRGAAGAFDYSYRADVAVDVPSDGHFHSLPVGTRTTQSEVLYVVVPREDRAVFREAHVHNPIAAPLLPGPVEVYVAGDYVLQSALPMVPAGGDFQLGLGVEQAIKCARNTRYREERSGSKVVATSELHHDISVELKNNLGREVAVEVRERIPQPSPNAEVVVEEGKVEPAWEAYLQRERGHEIEGGRRWKLTIAAGASARLAAEYVVKIYAQNEIVGGNRREA